MPKSGFKSVTINENVYNRFHKTWEKNREELYKKGIMTFTGYIQYNMEELMKQQTKMRFVVILVDEKLVVLKDVPQSKLINIEIYNNILHCTECKSSHCMHIGFCWSLHKLYPITVK